MVASFGGRGYSPWAVEPPVSDPFRFPLAGTVSVAPSTMEVLEAVDASCAKGGCPHSPTTHAILPGTCMCSCSRLCAWHSDSPLLRMPCLTGLVVAGSAHATAAGGTVLAERSVAFAPHTSGAGGSHKDHKDGSADGGDDGDGAVGHGHGHGQAGDVHVVFRVLHTLQVNAVPLLSGIALALIWVNAAPSSYEYLWGVDSHADHLMIFGKSASIFGHKVTLHYLINDIFMVLFFGIAAKEVTESCLPGGSLNPPRKALAPLVATVGGVVGPVAVYLLVTYVCYEGGLFDEYYGLPALAYNSSSGSHRMLATSATSGGAATAALSPVRLPYSDISHGWGVPTATDISLAWVVAARVRGARARARRGAPSRPQPLPHPCVTDRACAVHRPTSVRLHSPAPVPSVPIGAHRCPSVPIGAHRCSSVPIGAHRCSSVLIGACARVPMPRHRSSRYTTPRLTSCCCSRSRTMPSAS